MNIEMADDHNYSEWKPEIARWLEEATGHNPDHCLITDEADLTHMLEWKETGEWVWDQLPNFKTGEMEWEYIEIWDTDPDAYAHARKVLLKFGVDIDKEEDTRLISLAKKTMGN